MKFIDRLLLQQARNLLEHRDANTFVLDLFSLLAIGGQFIFWVVLPEYIRSYFSRNVEPIGWLSLLLLETRKS